MYVSGLLKVHRAGVESLEGRRTGSECRKTQPVHSKAGIEETKQAIWEGRLWEFAKSKCSNHPLAFDAFKLAMSESTLIEVGTQDFKERGIFVSDKTDVSRPEIERHLTKIKGIDFSKKDHLVVVPEPKAKPFLTSDIFAELLKLVDPDRTVISCVSPIFGISASRNF